MTLQLAQMRAAPVLALSGSAVALSTHPSLLAGADSRTRGWSRAAILGAAAVAFGVLSSAGPIRRADRRLFGVLNGARGIVADRLFSGVTELGSVWASLAAASLLAARREREAAARALAAALTTWSLGQGLKRMFGRERPYDALPERVRLLIARPQGTSWPSNHPATLLAFVTVAAAELDLGVPERAALYALAGCVGASRVYLGVHFPSDVVGGMLLAGAVAAASSRRDRRPPLQ